MTVHGKGLIDDSSAILCSIFLGSETRSRLDPSFRRLSRLGIDFQTSSHFRISHPTKADRSRVVGSNADPRHHAQSGDGRKQSHLQQTNSKVRNKHLKAPSQYNKLYLNLTQFMVTNQTATA